MIAKIPQSIYVPHDNKTFICGKMIFGRITIKNDASAQTHRLM
ncbi:hypothetical protein CUZ95_1390 [Enterococcus lactis]|nr:hypothetical protein [Enterococcus lactis]